MNCNDLQELLVPYVNGELGETQREFIEEHLTGCIACRIVLEDYRKTRDRLLSLRQTPEMPEIKEKTIAEIQSIRMTVRLKRFLRPVSSSLPVLLLVVIMISLQFSGIFSSSSEVISKAYAASSELQSFRYAKEEYDQDSPEQDLIHNFHAEIEYQAPDNYRFVSEDLVREPLPGIPSKIETIRIGDQVYTNMPFVTFKLDDEWFRDRLLTEQSTLELLNLLTDTRTLETEVIDGVECYHYVGQVDMEKYLDWQREDLEKRYYRMDSSLPYGMTDDLETYIEKQNERARTQEMIFEFWIGKQDFLLRQANLVYQTKEGEFSDWNEYRSIGIMNYYDFNEEVIIEAPLDSNGEMLDGWSNYKVEELEIPEQTEPDEPALLQRPSNVETGVPEMIDPAFKPVTDVATYRKESQSFEHVDGAFVNTLNTLIEYGGQSEFLSKYMPTENFQGFPIDSTIIIFGDTAYTYHLSTPITSAEDYTGDVPDPEETIWSIENLYNIEVFPDETIDGADCFHIRGILDVDKYLEWYRPEYRSTIEKLNESLDSPLNFEDGWATIDKIYHSKETIFEYWIGKDDYLIRKKIMTERDLLPDFPPLDDLSHESTRQVISLYEYNIPVDIQPPFETDAELPEGWLIYILD